MDIERMLLSPFDRRYCNWFYAGMVFFLCSVVASIISLVVPNKMNLQTKLYITATIIHALFGYINSRMWYSMCLR